MTPAEKKAFNKMRKLLAKVPVERQTVRIGKTAKIQGFAIKLDPPDPNFFTIHIFGQT
jgi:hypothetical protein